MKRSSYLIGMMGLLVFYFWGCFRLIPKKSAPGETPTGIFQKHYKPAPDFSLKDISGKTVHLSDFKGQVVVIDFWATWCPPCRAEIPHLIDFYHRYKNKGVTLIGISVDEDGVKVVKPFAEEQKMDYPVLLADDAVQEAYGSLEGIPTKIIIDKNGNIAARLVGYEEISSIEKKVLPLLQ